MMRKPSSRKSGFWLGFAIIVAPVAIGLCLMGLWPLALGWAFVFWATWPSTEAPPSKPRRKAEVLPPREPWEPDIVAAALRQRQEP